LAIHEMNKDSKCFIEAITILTSLEQELSAKCILQKTQDLNGHTLCCMFLADDLSGYSVFSESHCASITVDIWSQRVNDMLDGC
jgi:hypothetical protein